MKMEPQTESSLCVCVCVVGGGGGGGDEWERGLPHHSLLVSELK